MQIVKRRPWEKSMIFTNTVYILVHMLMDEIKYHNDWVCLSYTGIFSLLWLMNYSFEGMRISSILYIIAHPILIFCELTNHHHIDCIPMMIFALLCVIATLLNIIMNIETQVPVKGNFEIGYRQGSLLLDAISTEGEEMDGTATELFDKFDCTIWYPVKKGEGFEITGHKQPYWA